MNRRFIPVVALAILFAALLACGGSDTGSTPSGTAAPTDTQAPAAKPTAKPKLHTFTFQGNGTSKTAKFTTTSATWKLSWSCDPASYGSQYNLIATVTGSDGTPTDINVNVICKTGVTKGSTMAYNSVGTYFIDVISEGPWVLKVQEE